MENICTQEKKWGLKETSSEVAEGGTDGGQAGMGEYLTSGMFQDNAKC